MAQILIENKADTNSKDQLGKTPLYYAYREGYNKIAILLLQNKASPWSCKSNNIDQMVNSRQNNDMNQIKIAKQIHLMMLITPFKHRDKIWEDSKYLFKNIVDEEDRKNE
ncbi:hypothetical protein IMG5_056370 [Ichthyophthirius multifiliis]|uniref:Ankyrin repeat protein n=1 Tax=Ichthyophthirius multifiliis TaxID=5932 RepID=G0QN93_ICHMU|nr:hypothetical protein IMG5_056370 [Ichthyophthirius multifiliis]EGR33314.1 hypothetical protein IMG5_056370 [Ichthyophthirius multifiliis]|eukprot:XP_004037300.1 hypothetical protein IMG5_056370 [Ichthyophthirius multifiliis]